jgi:predicted transcriptional regulator
MTQNPITIAEDTPLEEVVHLMESRRIKRLPVMRDGKVVGIVSRANLLEALASVATNIPPAAPDDSAIRDQIITELSKQPWAPQLNVTVRNGIVDLWGFVIASNQREAAIVVAENISGVKKVRSHIAWLELQSGMVIQYPESKSE